jgi:uncharacterized protein
MAKNGCYELELKLPTDYDEALIIKSIQKKLDLKDFNYKILKKSLDARKKHNIVYVLKMAVFSSWLKNSVHQQTPKLKIIKQNRAKKVIVVGNGPAGFFCAYTLQKAGFDVTCLERGSAIDQRIKDVVSFDKTGILKDDSNYVYGEGGAGTFSDGKLTTRTKNIKLEQAFIIDEFIEAGAPDEIRYLNHPHIGSDNLKLIVKNLRIKFEVIGGKIIFDTKVSNFEVGVDKKVRVFADKKEYEADYVFFATGNSAYDTYRMLINNGISFKTKPFAIGVRVEHLQADINKAQWNVADLKGVKAAEYRLAYTTEAGFPVYSFCMCPGGRILCSASKNGQTNVNGASNYLRNSKWANSAIVVGVNFNKLYGRDFTALEALDWVDGLEKKAFCINNGFGAPFNNIVDFINENVVAEPVSGSYKFPIVPYDYKKLLPTEVEVALREGLMFFSKKIKGFEKGVMVGLETKTSPPVQVERNDDYTCNEQGNVYVIGEGAGHASGIITSAVDGVRAALGLI